MAVTFREMINRVLRTVAEDEINSLVTTLSDPYQILVATFVNQIKEEIEDAHNWRSLRQTFSVTVLSGQSSAVITGANERSRVFRIQDQENGQFVPLCFDLTDANSPIQLIEMPLAQLVYNDVINTSTVTAPSFFAVDNSANGDEVVLRLEGPVTSNRTISIQLIVPQARLGLADLDVVLKIPARPLEFGGIWYALLERGEELGVSSVFTEERFRNALDDAVARDAEEQGGVNLVVT